MWTIPLIGWARYASIRLLLAAVKISRHCRLNIVNYTCCSEQQPDKKSNRDIRNRTVADNLRGTVFSRRCSLSVSAVGNFSNFELVGDLRGERGAQRSKELEGEWSEKVILEEYCYKRKERDFYWSTFELCIANSAATRYCPRERAASFAQLN